MTLVTPEEWEVKLQRALGQSAPWSSDVEAFSLGAPLLLVSGGTSTDERVGGLWESHQSRLASWAAHATEEEVLEEIPRWRGTFWRQIVTGARPDITPREAAAWLLGHTTTEMDVLLRHPWRIGVASTILEEALGEEALGEEALGDDASFEWIDEAMSDSSAWRRLLRIMERVRLDQIADWIETTPTAMRGAFRAAWVRSSGSTEAAFQLLTHESGMRPRERAILLALLGTQPSWSDELADQWLALVHHITHPWNGGWPSLDETIWTAMIRAVPDMMPHAAPLPPAHSHRSSTSSPSLVHTTAAFSIPVSLEVLSIHAHDTPVVWAALWEASRDVPEQALLSRTSLALRLAQSEAVRRDDTICSLLLSHSTVDVRIAKGLWVRGQSSPSVLGESWVRWAVQRPSEALSRLEEQPERVAGAIFPREWLPRVIEAIGQDSTQLVVRFWRLPGILDSIKQSSAAASREGEHDAGSP